MRKLSTGSHNIGVCVGYNWLLDFQPISKWHWTCVIFSTAGSVQQHVLRPWTLFESKIRSSNLWSLWSRFQPSGNLKSTPKPTVFFIRYRVVCVSVQPWCRVVINSSKSAWFKNVMVSCLLTLQFPVSLCRAVCVISGQKKVNFSQNFFSLFQNFFCYFCRGTYHC